MKKSIWIVVLCVVVAILSVVVVMQVRRAAQSKEQPPLAKFAGMMKNPQMKDVMRGQQKMMVEQMYGALFKQLDRTSDQLDAFKNLLLERQMAMMDIGLAMMGGSGSDKKQATQKTMTIKADYDKKIQDMLGARDYQIFQDYENTLSERMQIQMFKSTLPTAAALTEQQEHDLIAGMVEERKAVEKRKATHASSSTKDQVAETLKQLDLLQQAYSNRAVTILTPAQFEQFTKWRQQMKDMQAASMKMMFGDKGPK